MFFNCTRNKNSSVTSTAWVRLEAHLMNPTAPGRCVGECFKFFGSFNLSLQPEFDEYLTRADTLSTHAGAQAGCNGSGSTAQNQSQAAKASEP